MQYSRSMSGGVSKETLISRAGSSDVTDNKEPPSLALHNNKL